ncbi:MAG: hypothetical protein WA869_22485, partial [Alloacidobacterium sp.]
MSELANAATVGEATRQEDLSGPPAANRHRLPDERAGITHHFSIAGHEGYLTVGLYPNGQPGEIFVRMAKEGSTIAGLMECFGTVVSVSLQHGVPLKVLCDKLSHTRFEPSGWTGNEELGYAKSIMDYLFRWMEYASCRASNCRCSLRKRRLARLLATSQTRLQPASRSSLRTAMPRGTRRCAP